MTDLRTAAQQALEALELAQTDVHWELNSPTRKFLRKAEKTLRAALAQQDEPVQEPVATLIAQRDALLEALRALVRNEGLDAYVYLDKGVGTETAAGQRWLNARAAIKAVEETK